MAAAASVAGPLAAHARAMVLPLLALAATSSGFTLGGFASKDSNTSDGLSECNIPHDEYMVRPVKDVLYLNSGVDGWCFYGWLGARFSDCAAARRKRDYLGYMQEANSGLDVWKAGGAPVALQYGGTSPETVITRDHVHPLYDTICAANGYYRLPREQVRDFDRWNELSDSHCRLLSQQYPEFFNMSMSEYFGEIVRHQDELRPYFRKTSFDVQSVSSVAGLRRGMFKIQAMHCMLGGVGCDMAMCLGRGCQDEMGEVHYGPECIRQ